MLAVSCLLQPIWVNPKMQATETYNQVAERQVAKWFVFMSVRESDVGKRTEVGKKSGRGGSHPRFASTDSTNTQFLLDI